MQTERNMEIRIKIRNANPPSGSIVIWLLLILFYTISFETDVQNLLYV